MRPSGFVVRFVDVVLILLFGFISIAETRQTGITLPESTETPLSPPDTEEVIYVALRPDGVFLVEDEQTALVGGDALHAFLLEAQAQYAGGAVKVRLRASYDTPMHYLMLAARLCDALGLPKVMEVQLKS